jgi:hypothetical protein
MFAFKRGSSEISLPEPPVKIQKLPAPAETTRLVMFTMPDFNNMYLSLIEEDCEPEQDDFEWFMAEFFNTSMNCSAEEGYILQTMAERVAANVIRHSGIYIEDIRRDTSLFLYIQYKKIFNDMNTSDEFRRHVEEFLLGTIIVEPDDICVFPEFGALYLVLIEENKISDQCDDFKRFMLMYINRDENESEKNWDISEAMTEQVAINVIRHNVDIKDPSCDITEFLCYWYRVMFDNILQHDTMETLFLQVLDKFNNNIQV